MFAIFGHTGECSYDSYEIVATFDSEELADQFIKDCLIKNMSVESMWPFKKNTLLYKYCSIYVAPYESSIPNNPKP